MCIMLCTCVRTFSFVSWLKGDFHIFIKWGKYFYILWNVSQRILSYLRFLLHQIIIHHIIKISIKLEFKENNRTYNFFFTICSAKNFYSKTDILLLSYTALEIIAKAIFYNESRPHSVF